MGRHTIRRRRSVSGRAFVTLLALVLVFGCAVGGTFAWLTAKTDAVVNTFTYGDINIGLAETTGNTYKIVPGVDIRKDPTVTVKAGSEACWLFVKVEEKDWPTFKEADGKTAKIDYKIASDWTELEGVSGVYYREVGEAAADTSFEVIKGNVITVSENLTKAEVNTVVALNPKLTFTAYAVQKDGVNSAADAWAKVSA